MKLRVIDYRPHTGGGKRFFAQLLKALQTSGEIAELEFVSHGDAMTQVRALFAEHGITAKFVDIPCKGGVRLDFTGHVVAPEAFDDCDVVWMPWVHFHRIPAETRRPVVASFHDALMFTEPKLVRQYPATAQAERETIRQWLASTATLVCSSRFSIDVLSEIFSVPASRLGLITLSGDHRVRREISQADTIAWPWITAPYILCPANISPHKNHEVLFEGYAKSMIAWPLVLTGSGADLVNHLPPVRRLLRRIAVMFGLRPPHRAALLRKLARRLGLKSGHSFIPVGYLSDAKYETVLEQANAVVMPTLGEGGGSFPVEEAALRGIPVICSDIPVLREQVARLGAEVLWFDPRKPGALATRIRELADGYEPIRARAREAAGRLHVRPWSEVAADYLAVFKSAAEACGKRTQLHAGATSPARP